MLLFAGPETLGTVMIRTLLGKPVILVAPVGVLIAFGKKLALFIATPLRSPSFLERKLWKCVSTQRMSSYFYPNGRYGFGHGRVLVQDDHVGLAR